MANKKRSTPKPPYIPKTGYKHGTRYGKGGQKK